MNPIDIQSFAQLVRAEDGLLHNEGGASKTVIRNTGNSVNQFTLFFRKRTLNIAPSVESEGPKSVSGMPYEKWL